ncbi:hypothetical protein PFISCL1PPCAC_11727, partial [Pristionchus fissidentatus]
MLFFSAVLLLVLFFHMFHVLRSETKTSASTKRMIRRSLKVLFVQIVVPLSLIIVPGFILLTSAACECIPFEIGVSAYFVIPFHPIAHNLLLLFATPAYRRRIVTFVRRI